MRRLGTDETVVEVGSNRGRVILTKSDTKNQYDVYKLLPDGTEKHHQFVAVNKTVPPIVEEILGMSVLDMGGISDLPNFMFQLDKHYMLSEINGSGCTNNMVARVIDNVIGLGGMEDLITAVSSDGASSKRKLSSNTNRITELKTDLHDEFDLNEKKVLFAKCNTEWSELDKDSKMRDTFANIYTSFIKTDNKISTINIAIIAEGPIDEYLADNVVIGDKYKLYSEYLLKYDLYYRDSTALKKIIDELDGMENLLLIKSEITDLENLKQKYNDIIDDLTALENTDAKYNKTSVDYISFDNAETKALKDIEIFKNENPECPTCGKPFDK